MIFTISQADRNYLLDNGYTEEKINSLLEEFQDTANEAWADFLNS